MSINKYIKLINRSVFVLAYHYDGEALRQEAIQPDHHDDDVALPATEDAPLPLEAEQANTSEMKPKAPLERASAVSHSQVTMSLEP